MHYYQHHIGDFIKATSRLTDSQAMAYLRLIWIYYDRNGVVENDPKQLAFEIGSDVETVSLIIKTYFEIDGSNLRQSRCDKELEGYIKKSTGGKTGAEKRWKNKDSNSLPIGIPMPPQCDPNANQEPITNNHKPINKIQTPDGVSDFLFKEYLAYRKKKRKTWSKRIENKLVKEGKKLGWDLTKVFEHCLENDWAGFEASWVQAAELKSKKSNELPLGTDKQIEEAYRIECNADPAKARFNSYYDMKQFILKKRDEKRVS